MKDEPVRTSELIEEMLEEPSGLGLFLCGCRKGAIRPGCPVHDPERRKTARPKAMTSSLSRLCARARPCAPVRYALAAGVTLPEASVLGRHADARVTAVVYAGVADKTRATIAGKLTDAGIGT